ncbi:MAG: hypothetical protein LQ351_006522 [Letrouitia transgressa]|nr:MAG: hypothetical protein LQ351_006522 [Letrouitia transgressa]
MQALSDLCNRAKSFPLNLHQQQSSLSNQSLYEELDAQAARLFSKEDESVLNFLELNSNAIDFRPRSITTESQLRTHLGLTTSTKTFDPRCRFLFVQSIKGSTRGELQVCYNLMSAERSGSGPSDWSVRPFAVHHTLDMINIRANWIIIKGNDNMKDFFEKATTGQGHTNFSSFDTLDRSFAASLAAHLVFCGWAAERWRWYINNLEDQFQNFSRKTLTAPVIAASKPGFPFIKDDFQTQHRNDNSKTSGAIAARLTRTQKWIAKKFPISIPKPVSPVQLTYTDPDSGLSQPLPPHITLNSAPGPAAQPSRPIFENMEEQDFSFAKLQKIQYIEEKAHEALLTIRLNVNVITQLQQYYSTVPKTKHFPQSILRTFKDDLNQFRLRINTILNDLQIQTLRLETLLRLLDNRKTLLHSILEYRNTEINKLSNKNMVSMTEDMNDIARKTKIETVSMKVITVVTLFFLPGTFISTLMSTAIFQPSASNENTAQHPGPNPYAHLSPLQVYLAISLPLTFVTIVVWAFLHWIEKRKEKIKAQAYRLDSSLRV